MITLFAFFIIFGYFKSVGDPPLLAQANMPIICVDPQEILGEPGVDFSINIKIINVTRLYSWEVILSWDKDVLEVTNVVEGPFLSQGGQYSTYFVKKIYNDKGFVRIDCTIMGGDATTNADGSGTLATITFSVKTPGTTPIHFNQTLLLTYYLNVIEHTTIDGFFYTNYPVAKFTYHPTNPSPGKSITFNASLSSDYVTGIIAEYIWDFGDENVTSTSNPIIKHTYDSAGEYNVTLTVFNGLGLSHETCRIVEVIELSSDINGDNKVNYKDLFMFAAAYGATLGDERYNPACDFNNDTKVDYKDLFILAAEYGREVDP